MAFIFTVTSCDQHDPHEDYSSSSVLSFNLINVCVEKALNAHSELNTNNYVLDMNEISTLNQQGVDSFVKLRNPLLETTHDDSVFVLANKEWSRSRLLQNIIVKFLEVDYIDKRNVCVKLSKMRAKNQTIKITLDLEREDDSYRIVKSEVKR